MTRIPSDLARFGLKVELVPGWETRGSSSFAPAGVVDHWTAGPRGTMARPSLNVCVYGRSDLPGPLANIYLARDGTCVVLAAGRANHAGTGGWRGLVGNSAVYGIEAESAGDGDWTPAMLDAYPRLNAALLSGLGRGVEWLCGHHLWAPGRKIDIRDVFERIKADTARHLAGGIPAPAAPPEQEDDDMNDFDRAVAMETLQRVQSLTFPKPGKPHVDQPWLPMDSFRTVDILDGSRRIEAEISALRAQNTELVKAIASLAAGDDIDVDALVARIDASLDSKLADHAKLVKVQVSVDDAPQP